MMWFKRLQYWLLSRDKTIQELKNYIHLLEHTEALAATTEAAWKAKFVQEQAVSYELFEALDTVSDTLHEHDLWWTYTIIDNAMAAWWDNKDDTLHSEKIIKTKNR